jgi:UDP-N-acetylmuramoyl-L-alanyl-D-glutamate--2,6-diaminopimelate ligase
MRACPAIGQPISLRQVLPEADFFGPDDIRATSCSCDSRSVESGDLFVALPGRVLDGLDFAREAVWRGCRAVLAERSLPELGVPLCRVPDVRAAYGRVCQALAGNPSQNLKVIGVTGTNGKTTTSCLIASILSGAGHQVGLVGTLGAFDGVDFADTSLTTPPPAELATWLSRMAANDCTHAVLEVSSHALDQSRLAGISLDAACVTNVRRDHLDYHPTVRDYRLAKSKLLEYLVGEGFAVINADDPTSAAFLHGVNLPVLTVAINSAAEITATPLERFLSEQTFLITAGSETVPVCTRMIGTHHIYNCLVATAVGLAYGVDLPTIVRALEDVEHLPGRLERIECGQPFGVFVDYAHTPDALSGSLQALREVVDRRIICVFGAGGDRDRPKRPLMGQAVGDEADMAVITTDNPRSEAPEGIARDILGGFRSTANVKLIPERSEAIAWALSEASPGDCVLIAGKGHEKIQIIGDERILFDDRHFAREWLYETQPYAVPASSG